LDDKKSLFESFWGAPVMDTVKDKMPFFRYDKGTGRGKPGAVLGDGTLCKIWKRARRNLGIEDVDLYGGTRHSSMQHLRELIGEPGEKRLSDHEANAALHRYLQASLEEMGRGYGLARRCNSKVTPIRGGRDD
jgi:hypothetical protein